MPASDSFNRVLSPFGEAVKYDGPPNLDPREQVLARYAIAVAKEDRDQARAARRDAVEVGLTEAELAHVRALVLKFEIDRLDRFDVPGSCCG